MSLSNEQFIQFFTLREEHYPYSDRLMEIHKDKKEVYKSFADEFVTKKYGKDKDFFENEMVKNLLNDPVQKDVYFPKRGNLEPNQKWHLLCGCYLWYLANTENPKEILEREPVNFSLKKRGQLKCPELILWMMEASKDDLNITDLDIKTLFEHFKKLDDVSTDQWWKSNKGIYWDKMIGAINHINENVQSNNE